MNGGTARPDWRIDFMLLAAIWGSSFLFMRLATVEFGALPTAALRVGIASLVLLPWLLWRGQARAMLPQWKPIFAVGMLNSGVPFALYAFALHAITTGLSSILNATVPLFGALVAWVWLGERPGRWRAAGLVIGFAGVALLSWDKASFKPQSDGSAPGWAVLACLGATLCYALAASFTRRHLTGLPPLVTATGSQIGATLGLALPAAATWPAHTPGLQAWLALLAVGVLCTALAYVLFFRLIDTAGPTRALTVTYLVPMFAIGYGVALLGEPVAWSMLAGALVIMLGTALSTGLLGPRR